MLFFSLSKLRFLDFFFFFLNLPGTFIPSCLNAVKITPPTHEKLVYLDYNLACWPWRAVRGAWLVYIPHISWCNCTTPLSAWDRLDPLTKTLPLGLLFFTHFAAVNSLLLGSINLGWAVLYLYLRWLIGNCFVPDRPVVCDICWWGISPTQGQGMEKDLYLSGTVSWYQLFQYR